MKLSTRYPQLDLSSDGSNLRDVVHTIWDAFRRIAIAFNTPDSGNSASRPSAELVAGQTYFDLTLNIPIWWDGTQWVDATGAPV
jgi:hypothetical protein